MRPWPQHVLDEMQTDSDDPGEPVAAVTIWTADTEHRINLAQLHDLGDHVDVKIHSDHFAGSASTSSSRSRRQDRSPTPPNA